MAEQQIKILVVDKDQGIVDVFCRLFEKTGAQAIPCVAAEGFSEMNLMVELVKHSVTHFVLDAGIKNHSGVEWDVLRAIDYLLQCRIPPQNIVVWGAIVRTDLQMHLIGLGVRYLVKPVNTSLLFTLWGLSIVKSD